MATRSAPVPIGCKRAVGLIVGAVSVSAGGGENGVSINLPYVDEHALTVAAPRDLVWAGLQRYAAVSIGIPGGGPLARILGTVPRSGFEVTQTVPAGRLTLTGRHRFSRYALVFDLRDTTSRGTVLRATTYAVFPGPLGRMYRALVIGTGAHAVATNRMLHAIGRLSLNLTPEPGLPGT
jgi:hypothetical protein